MMTYYIDKDQALILIDANKEVIFKAINYTFKLKHLKNGYRVNIYNASLDEVFKYQLGERVVHILFSDFESAYDFMYDYWFKLVTLRNKKLSELNLFN